MRKRVKRARHENHERWLVSYADFITLLFAFFVVLYATGQTNKEKAQQFSDAAREAFENQGVSSAVQAILGGSIRDRGKGNAQLKGPGGSEKIDATSRKVADLLPSLAQLKADLQVEIVQGKIELKLEERGLVISLKEAAFFAPGEDAIARDTYGSLGRVAAVINKIPNPVRFEGHTDAIPIHNSRFRSNWELSAARAIAMMEIFGTQFQLAHDRMAISGYADTVPVASNQDESGRAQNRRVDILILSARGMLAEPAQSTEAAASK